MHGLGEHEERRERESKEEWEITHDLQVLVCHCQGSNAAAFLHPFPPLRCCISRIAR